MVIKNHLSANYTEYCNTIILNKTIDNKCMIKKNDINVYTQNEITEDNTYFYIKLNDDNSLPSIYIYNYNNTKLLYTNDVLEYDIDENKYTIYGYFISSITNITCQITNTGWQKLSLSSDILFK